jgi:hypothetical protein
MQALASVLVAGKWHCVEVCGCRLQVVPSVASSLAKCLSLQEFIETGFLPIDSDLIKSVPHLPDDQPPAVPSEAVLGPQHAAGEQEGEETERRRLTTKTGDESLVAGDQKPAAEQASAGEQGHDPEAAASTQTPAAEQSPAPPVEAAASVVSSKAEGLQQRKVELAAASDLRLQSFNASLEVLPVEDAAKMIGQLSLLVLVGNAKQAKNEAALESLADDIEAAHVQANQLIKCLQKGAKDRACNLPHTLGTHVRCRALCVERSRLLPVYVRLARSFSTFLI